MCEIIYPRTQTDKGGKKGRGELRKSGDQPSVKAQNRTQVRHVCTIRDSDSRFHLGPHWWETSSSNALQSLLCLTEKNNRLVRVKLKQTVNQVFLFLQEFFFHSKQRKNLVLFSETQYFYRRFSWVCPVTYVLTYCHNIVKEAVDAQTTLIMLIIINS